MADFTIKIDTDQIATIVWDCPEKAFNILNFEAIKLLDSLVDEVLLNDNIIGAIITSAKPDFAAGHSLGEFVALYAAEVFDFETGLRLLKTRSELMASAGGGAMAAVLGFDRKQLDDFIKEVDGFKSVKLISNKKAEFILKNGSKKIIDF